MRANRAIAFVLTLCFSLAAPADGPLDAGCSMQLQTELQQALMDKGEDYQPGTGHLRADGRPLFTNRLILEDSPYLLQHAHNPVDWHTWGPEAFECAREENRPVFLSIGYSTCHWCHVMKRESFEDIEIARYLNKHFIPIKVDRERRPDVDEIYMSALMLTKGQGGWPLSGFLTYEGKPFYSGAYYPPEQFLEILKQIREMWEAQQEELELLAAKIADAVKNSVQVRGSVAASAPGLVKNTVSGILRQYDTQWGGFGSAPKFTNESSLLLLLQHGYRNIDSDIIAAAEHTLMRMAHGGLYDQVAGGFHRYSTDRYWLVPHFEKMLYHQANMARVYLTAYRYTGNGFFARIAEQTLNYILRDMTSPLGGFYSAHDAESAGEEGRYYVWTIDEMHKSLSREDAMLAQSVFGLTERGNFNGKNILYLPDELSHVGTMLDINEQDLTARLDGIREKLLRERAKRTPPPVDKKILVGWNGMVVTVLAQSAQVLNRQGYLEAAIRAADFLWEHQRLKDGTLLRINYGERASTRATQDDYAYFAEGLIALYDVTGNRLWLKRAREITDIMIDKFWDSDSGGFYMSEARNSLFVRPKQVRDGDIPSGNSVALHVLAGLSRRIGDWNYNNLANQLIQSYAALMDEHPGAYPFFMVAVDELQNKAAGATEYAAQGEIKLTAQGMGANSDIKLSLDISPGWHINAYNPGYENLIPLDIKISGDHGQWELKKVFYPEPRLKKLSFAGDMLALYENSINIALQLGSPGDKEGFGHNRMDIEVRLQACDDEVCLPPEETVLEYLH